MTTDPATPIDLIRQAVPGAAIELLPSVDMPTVSVDRDHIVDVLRVLRDAPELQFAFLADVTAVDSHPASPRFAIVYHLACLGEAYATSTPAAPARRLRVKVAVPGDDPWIHTATSVYPTANWLEREVFDLFGIHFEGHPDLRRILMPEDWEGFPLRKDYPVQIRKTPTSWSPVQLTPEEFAENVRARQRQADRAAEPDGGGAGD